MSWPTASGATGDGTDGVTVVTPMTLSPLLLAAASSSSSDVLRSVEAQLKNLEVKPGFYSSLLTLLQHEEGISDVTRLQVKRNPRRYTLISKGFTQSIGPEFSFPIAYSDFKWI